jgi:hypothetical protein
MMEQKGQKTSFDDLPTTPGDYDYSSDDEVFDD